METEVGVEGNGGRMLLEDGEVEKMCSPSAPSQQIPNPIVYKLVRVEGDGRLVPATDDEVMDVAELFLDDNIDTDFIDTEQSLGCISGDEIHQLESLGGFLQADKLDVVPEIMNAQLQEPFSELAPDFCESLMTECGSAGDCPDALVKLSEDGPSSPVASSIPDFSKIKGEICLDNLSIRELHDTFKATFGRETSVKDKQWLKRRIAMGLTNSCDVVSASSFTIRDNKLVDNNVSCQNVGAVIRSDQPHEASSGEDRQLQIIQSSEHIDQPVFCDKRWRDSGTSENPRETYDNTEERAAKRVRKPTKRYIEELSETESKEAIGRVLAVSPSSRPGQPSPNSHARLARNESLGSRTVVIRSDSLGGCEIQIPCVCRVRRSRPRKNFSTLLRFNGLDVITTVVKKTFKVDDAPPDDENANIVTKAESTPEQSQPLLVDVPYKENQLTVVGTAVGVEPKHGDSSGDSDDNIATVPTPKGGFRRKHHRAWTLSEVIKLVEGVSKFGAGRWSEIKRLSFASYSYRTSVDLKDKWRNLLKASFAPPDKGVGPRKNAATTPIPPTILLRVRELAEMQSLVRPGSKVVGSVPGDNGLERQPGYL
ncbi:unnamed protein product [Linum trigynum]|uniref:Uncharacterized protein n=1 Tax=Linum trigynum TaxID=586398 RepID=A0AAV2FNY9_9ROSI